MSEKGEVVTLERRGKVAVVRLNRPDVLNAVNEAVMAALERTIGELDREESIVALILTGAEGGRAFCVGGDLRYFDTLRTRAEGIAMSERMQKILSGLSGGRRVVIAAVNGAARGGGCEILTACHFRVAAATATFAFVHAKKGLVTGWGGGVRLFRLVGRTQALRLLLTGEEIAATEALRIGLVDRVVAPGMLLSEAMAKAEAVAANSSPSVLAFVKLLDRLEQSGSEAAVREETSLFGDLWESAEFRGMMAEFLKRHGKDENRGEGGKS